MISVAIVLGDRADLDVLASEGALWVEDTSTNRKQIESLWKLGVSATLFQPKEMIALIEDVDLHHPDWSELRILRP